MGRAVFGDSLVETVAGINPPKARSHYTLVSGETDLYMYGGLVNNVESKELYRYTPSTNTWVRLADGPQVVRMHTAVYYNGRIYVSGGYTGSGYVGNTWIYTVATNTWTTGATKPNAVATATSLLYNGKMYVAGGTLAGGNTPQNKLHCYDPVANTWVEKRVIPVALRAANLVEIDGLFYLFNGVGNATGVYRYDPVTDTWVTLGLKSDGRSAVAAAKMGTKIYCLGSTSKTTVLIYDTLTDTWTEQPLPDMITLYNIEGVAFLDSMYIFGGTGPAGVVQSALLKYRMAA